MIDTSTAKFEEERSHALVRELDRDQNSPFYREIQMTGRREEGFISQASLITYIKPFFRKGGLFINEEYSSFNKQYAILSDYFNALQDALPSDWANKDSIISKTSGINAFFRLLRDICLYLRDNNRHLEYNEFRDILEKLSDFPMDVETHKKYGTGGAIALHEELKRHLKL